MITTKLDKIKKIMEQKGWDIPFQHKTLHILSRAELSKHPYVKKIDKSLFWLLLSLAIIGNVGLLFGFLPIYIHLSVAKSLFFTGILGLCFGFLFDKLLHDSEYGAHHYIFGSVIVTLVTSLVFIGLFFLAKEKILYTGLFLSIHPVAILILYMVSFFLPHIKTLVDDHAID